MKTPTLLIVDDEQNICLSLKASLESPRLNVVTATTAKEGLALFAEQRPAVVLLDVRLPDMSGLDLYTELRKQDVRVPVIIMTAFARTETAIEATRRGAFDYLIKPVDLKRLRDVINKALETHRISETPVVLSEAGEDWSDNKEVIVGNSPAMQEVYKTIGRVAMQDTTVLILGESGAGKELVARALWNYSPRQDKPFLAINCAALPEALLESELFGHERGAFTGAEQRRIGKFEQLNGGTIFLDEIGDMSSAMQAKALRLLQQQQFERVGGNVTIQTDVRVIAATNRDLASMVEQGTFRRDLYYRLNGITIHLPPLRERREDIAPLTRHFARQISREIGRTLSGIVPDVFEQLMEHSWPGNVRELESAIRFAILHSSSDVITADCLPDSCRPVPRTVAHGQAATVVETTSPDLERLAPATTTGGFDLPARVRQLLIEGKTNLYREITAEVDRIIMSEVMNHVHGNQLRAAELLGISRVTLRSKLRAANNSENSPGDRLEASSENGDFLAE